MNAQEIVFAYIVVGAVKNINLNVQLFSLSFSIVVMLKYTNLIKTILSFLYVNYHAKRNARGAFLFANIVLKILIISANTCVCSLICSDAVIR